MVTGTRLAGVVLSAAAVLLSACAGKQRENSEDNKSAKVKMAAMSTAWSGKPYKDLLAAYGEPSLIMEVPYARVKTSVVIYPYLDKILAKCQHAFTVVHGSEPTIQNYHCQ